MSNVVKLPANRSRPRTFTRHEDFIEALREELLTSKMRYTEIAIRAHVANSTISNIASGKTRWPRYTTLFPLLEVMRKRIALVDD
jgi:transcriptional regulator with XRE-family HTH domain